MTARDDQDHSAEAVAPCAVDVFVAPGFVQLEVSCIVDTLRIANRVSGQQIFSYTYRTASAAGPVESSSGSTVQAQAPDARPEADIAVFVGNADPEFSGFFTRNLLDGYRGRGREVILLSEAASHYIKSTDKQDLALTTHWESADRLLQSAPYLSISPTLATKTGNLVTCAGMISSLDWALSVVEARSTKLIADHVRQVHLYGNWRDLRSVQQSTTTRRFKNGLTSRAVAIMEQNLAPPLSIAELAKEVGASTRALERQFKASVGKSPMVFYRELRLLRAKDLIINTNQSIQVIAESCGFGTSFSKQFKDHFGVSPTKLNQ